MNLNSLSMTQRTFILSDQIKTLYRFKIRHLTYVLNKIQSANLSFLTISVFCAQKCRCPFQSRNIAYLSQRPTFQSFPYFSQNTFLNLVHHLLHLQSGEDARCLKLVWSYQWLLEEDAPLSEQFRVEYFSFLIGTLKMLSLCLVYHLVLFFLTRQSFSVRRFLSVSHKAVSTKKRDVLSAFWAWARWNYFSIGKQLLMTVTYHKKHFHVSLLLTRCNTASWRWYPSTIPNHSSLPSALLFDSSPESLCCSNSWYTKAIIYPLNDTMRR